MSDFSAVAAAQQIAAASATGRALQGMMAQRRTYVETISEQAVRNGHLQGFVPLDGSGETDVQINFPIQFLEKPLFTFGLEMGPNQEALPGSFPLASATVLRWIKQAASGNREVFIGAHLGVVVIGQRAMTSILHYSFQGQSFTSPPGANTSVTGKL